MDFRRTSYNILIAVEAIAQNKLRGVLTSLGIIFGVASVIAMLAIGTGAKMKIIEQIKFLGANNIIILKYEEKEEDKQEAEDKKENKRFTPGLTLADVEGIQKMIPGITYVSPEIEIKKSALREGITRRVALVGVTNDFFHASRFELSEGAFFTNEQVEGASAVCIIGSAIKSRFFPKEKAVGKTIKVGATWLTVVGVAESRRLAGSQLEGLGIRDYNLDIYTPVQTALLRFTDRARINSRDMKAAAGGGGMFMMMDEDEAPKDTEEDKNYHQVDRITVTVAETRNVVAVAEILSRMLARRHNGVADYEIRIPEQMLKQEQQTQDTFNFTLGAIAFISLLVGGIGIMNIMLASVMERIREIGLRLSLGATQRDITEQFLSEAVSLSLGGGIIGIFLGIGFSYLIEWWSQIDTIISPFSIILSFFVSATVGIIFGYFPARRAAKQDPVISLRYE